MDMPDHPSATGSRLALPAWAGSALQAIEQRQWADRQSIHAQWQVFALQWQHRQGIRCRHAGDLADAGLGRKHRAAGSNAFARADQALYKAKREGRNRIELG